MSEDPVKAAPVDIRAEFVRLICDDLYGPAGGPDEQLSDYRPSERYLVGALAPRGLVAFGSDRVDDKPVHQDEGDEPIADTTAAAPSLFPSSKGLSFAVPADVSSVAVTATWGRYLREEIEVTAAVVADAPAADLDAGAGGTIRAWQRYPGGGQVVVDLPGDGGPIGPIAVDAQQPSVVLTGRATRHGSFLLVSVFLVNEQPVTQANKDEAWLFQAELSIEAVDGSAAFVGRDRVLGATSVSASEAEQRELAALDMLYRQQVEFAVGHGTAVHATCLPSDPWHAIQVATVTMPAYEVPRTDPPRPDEPGLPDLSSVTLDMSVLAAAEAPSVLVARLGEAYAEWLEAQAQRIEDPDLADHRTSALKALEDARVIHARLQAGIDVLRDDPEAAEVFRFANWAMWQQRVRTLAADRARRTGEPFAACLAAIDAPANRSWRPFQLAFILLNLPALTNPLNPERSSDPLVDLLFFPTGGGKTEAYLGLTAYAFGIRRLQGDRFGLDGSEGVAVLMRYTLRLLTAQQFQRAAALVAACEVRRRQLLAAGDARWGSAPFRIGLWVGGSVTPNTSSDANQVVVAARAGGRGGSGRANPVQLTACPWCGSTLGMAADARADAQLWRTLLYCSDKFGECEFTEAGEQRDGIMREGIPVVTVDDELYRLLPSLVISTADKFAQLPWQGPLHLLFGKASRKCTRHGFRSPDLDKVGAHEEKDSHPANGGLPPAKTIDVSPLRPIDLIIQDELHLISGPLGSLTGLYETAIDTLATWTVDGVAVRPKVIASTATVRRAADQVHALFDRRLAVFPPPVLDVSNNFFSIQRPTRPDPAHPELASAPGRLYLGVCGFGHRLKAVQARVFITLLAAGRRLYERYGEDADPYLTMIGYYNALRELAGGRRLIDDDVRSRIGRAQERGLAMRHLRIVEELTSRKSSAEIPSMLDQLSQSFTKVGEDAHEARKTKANAPASQADDYRPIDVLLATNMISVGVDVPRLGLMAVIGQPKATSEYIQATSRVGRSERGPGLVVTIYNWARPRDLSHYEAFEHYHATFYRSVEALSVTPFAPRAIDRGLTAVLVSLVRHAHAQEPLGASWNPEPGAQIVPAASSAEIDALVAAIAARGERVTGDTSVRHILQESMQQRRTSWMNRQALAMGQGAQLTFRGRGGTSQPLLLQPAPGRSGEWTCPNSLRETEASINLQIDLWDASLNQPPPYALPQEAVAAGEAAVELTAEDLSEVEADAETAEVVVS